MTPSLDNLKFHQFKMREKPITPERLQRNLKYLETVRLLRKLLPGMAAALILAIVLWPKIDEYLNAIPSDQIQVEEHLKMKNKLFNPKMRSLDQRGRPYTVTAVTATQVDNETAKFEKPDSSLELEDGRQLKITAEQGQFKESSNHLEYHQNVKLQDNEGYELRTQSAGLDLTTKVAEGHVPVEGEGPTGTISAEGFKVDQEGNRIHFTGKSHLVILTTPETGDKK